LDSGEYHRTCTRPRIADTTTEDGSDGASCGVRTAAALRAVTAGVADGSGVPAIGCAVDDVRDAVGGDGVVGVVVGVIVLTATDADGVGVADRAGEADAAAACNGGWLAPAFPLAASATAVTPTAAASAAPLTRPVIRIRIPGKRDRPAVCIRLDE
jgi:hypothetical protein